jgi:hypothetical protein
MTRLRDGQILVVNKVGLAMSGFGVRCSCCSSIGVRAREWGMLHATTCQQPPHPPARNGSGDNSMTKCFYGETPQKVVADNTSLADCGGGKSGVNSHYELDKDTCS